MVVYLDDILIAGEDEQGHLRILDKVLAQLAESGLQVKQDKCVFMAPSVSFLGYQIDAEGQGRSY